MRGGSPCRRAVADMRAYSGYAFRRERSSTMVNSISHLDSVVSPQFSFPSVQCSRER